MGQDTLRSELLTALPVEHAFLRPGEGSPTNTCFVHQVHGAKVLTLTADGPKDSSHLEADGMVSPEGGRVLGLVVADCIPVLMSDPAGSIVAAVHAGLAGLMRGVLPGAIEALGALGVDPGELRCALGPSIRVCCYEVSSPVIQTLETRWGGLWRDTDRPWRRGRLSPVPPERPAPRGDDVWLSLQQVAVHQLRDKGVEAERIEDLEHCTYCSPLGLGSHRRHTHQGSPRRIQQAWIRAKV